MIYKSKVITKARLSELLLWSRLANHKVNANCANFGNEYDFGNYEWVGDETIITAVPHYIDDYSAEWVEVHETDKTMVNISTTEGHDDYFYLNTKDFDKLTDIEHQDSLANNDLFNTMLEFYKKHEHEYDYCGNLEDFTLPLDILLKHIKRHEKSKFRGTTDLDHTLHWMSDRWDMYLPYFKEHKYASTASEEQDYMFNKFFA